MKCHTCNSTRILNIHSHAKDSYTIESHVTGHRYEGYLPDFGVGSGDDLEIDLCLQCGQVQGLFPIDYLPIENPDLKPDDLLFDEDEDEDEDDGGWSEWCDGIEIARELSPYGKSTIAVVDSEKYVFSYDGKCEVTEEYIKRGLIRFIDVTELSKLQKDGYEIDSSLLTMRMMGIINF